MTLPVIEVSVSALPHPPTVMSAGKMMLEAVMGSSFTTLIVWPHVAICPPGPVAVNVLTICAAPQVTAPASVQVMVKLEPQLSVTKPSKEVWFAGLVTTVPVIPTSV